MDTPDVATSAVRPAAHGSRPAALRLGILAAVLVAALALGGVGGLLVGRGVDAAQWQTSRASLTIEGPTAVTVDEEVTFTASVTGLDSWVWTLPSGRFVLDQETVTVSARTPGTSHLVLRGQDADGQELEVTHPLTVTE